jgi:hypothetical protein
MIKHSFILHNTSGTHVSLITSVNSLTKSQYKLVAQSRQSFLFTGYIEFDLFSSCVALW